ncbi:MAG: NADP-dependent oxidoreductase [Alteraurantiacibacter sp.]
MTNEALIIQFASGPEYRPDCLKLEPCEVPRPGEGEVLLRPLLLSIDPTNHNWLKLQPQSNPFGLEVGSAMKGPCVAEIVESRTDRFAAGQKVTAMAGWERLSVVPGHLVQPLIEGVPLEAHLTIFSHVGLAAATGLIEVGRVQEDDVVVVSAAAGATGSVAVEMAVAYGARVIGIAGGAEKCRFVVEELGAEACIDYRAEDVEAELGRLCPAGVTLFFDNVGGAVLDAVLMNMALNSRIVVCGQIALYNSVDRNDGQGVRNLMELVFRRIRMQGFIAGEPHERLPEYIGELKRLFDAGKINSRVHIVQRLEKAPQAIELLFAGKNTGKVIVEAEK